MTSNNDIELGNLPPRTTPTNMPNEDENGDRGIIELRDPPQTTTTRTEIQNQDANGDLGTGDLSDRDVLEFSSEQHRDDSARGWSPLDA